MDPANTRIMSPARSCSRHHRQGPMNQPTPARTHSLVWEQEVPGSNPGAPTKTISNLQGFLGEPRTARVASRHPPGPPHYLVIRRLFPHPGLSLGMLTRDERGGGRWVSAGSGMRRWPK